MQQSARLSEALNALGKACSASKQRFSEIDDTLQARAFQLLHSGDEVAAKTALTVARLAFQEGVLLDVELLCCAWFANSSCDADRALARESVISQVRSRAERYNTMLARPKPDGIEADRQMSDIVLCQADALASLVKFADEAGITEVAEITPLAAGTSK